MEELTLELSLAPKDTLELWVCDIGAEIVGVPGAVAVMLPRELDDALGRAEAVTVCVTEVDRLEIGDRENIEV